MPHPLKALSSCTCAEGHRAYIETALRNVAEHGINSFVTVSCTRAYREGICMYDRRDMHLCRTINLCLGNANDQKSLLPLFLSR